MAVEENNNNSNGRISIRDLDGRLRDVEETMAALVATLQAQRVYVNLFQASAALNVALIAFEIGRRFV